jgi:hypothetical protein
MSLHGLLLGWLYLLPHINTASPVQRYRDQFGETVAIYYEKHMDKVWATCTVVLMLKKRVRL